MARRTFFSFHYIPDCQRAAQVRNMGLVEGNEPASDNDWETVTKGGDAAIKKWIADQLTGKSCTIVLIGSRTSERKWVTYEIVKSWNDETGVVGIYIHNLKNLAGEQSSMGSNPFDGVTIDGGKKKLSSVVKAYDPPYATSTGVYAHIRDNLAGWVDEAVAIRRQN